MTRFERVIQILDTAVNGPTAPVGFHGAFWRGITRDQFVAKKIFGLDLLAVGNGAGSNLIKALKGQSPFGADLSEPPPDADFNRMPSGRPPVPAGDVRFIEQWIDEGCPEDPVVVAGQLRWHNTGAPRASSRTDDIWFLSPEVGWAVNSDGNILKTSDGGDTWTTQHSAPGVYLRCLGFANANVGWVGTLTRSRRLLHTANGGADWSVVSPLPVNAPAAICGISVVSDQIVYCSGTNRPTDSPRVMKTVDGGRTWVAQDMSPHASILIDAFFTDALHGWVVGGKADVPHPTDRERIKPVVLRTEDGGATWSNRLAGREADFPFGEWGWKIQFLDSTVGFVSLENFQAGAILKTTDGGLTWRRLTVNDAQGNANIEGIGFIDEGHGWIGGWGSADFTGGFSSATDDGGQNWRDANEIGKFLNRFRFFGNPVAVGYASGDTVYKYSADPVTSRLQGLTAATRPLLPNAIITANRVPIEIRMDVHAGAKRLTLQVWDRFGTDVGCILDEIRPKIGARVFAWDGRDVEGMAIPPGPYIVRLTVDDVVASSILDWQRPGRAPAPRAVPAVHRRRPMAVVTPRPRTRTIAALMGNFTPSQRDLQWLTDALQIAAQLELATLPPYLTARWTIKDAADPVSQSIAEIRREEMRHFGLVCNLLVAIDGTPVLATPEVVPRYPGGLPGGVRPGLEIVLRRLSKDQAKVFMDIEYPQGGPIATRAMAETFDSIGEFYAAILATFQALDPPLREARQLEGPLELYKIGTLEKVKETIELINRQGEGSNVSPEEVPEDLAHYYRFGEIHHGKRLVRDLTTGKWSFTGADLPMPETWPMADVPAGGYQQTDVPDLAVWDLVSRLDHGYSDMLRSLEAAWQHGDGGALDDAVGFMFAMGSVGRQLVRKPKPDGTGNYGPCFRLVPVTG
jgi:photosystem II stability/assembly factor-like uncharacterized protein